MNAMNIHAWRLQNVHDIVESKFEVSATWNTWKHFVEGSVTVFLSMKLYKTTARRTRLWRLGNEFVYVTYHLSILEES